MPTVTLTAAAGPYTRAVTAICTRHGYQATIDGVPNPQTPQEFFKQHLVKYVTKETREHEANTAAAAAAAAAGSSVDTELVIT